MNGHGKIEGVVHVSKLGIGTKANSSGILSESNGLAGSTDLLVIIVDYFGDVHVVGAGIDGVECFSIRRDGGLPRVGHDVNTVVGVQGHGGAPLGARIGVITHPARRGQIAYG